MAAKAYYRDRSSERATLTNDCDAKYGPYVATNPNVTSEPADCIAAYSAAIQGRRDAKRRFEVYYDTHPAERRTKVTDCDSRYGKPMWDNPNYASDKEPPECFGAYTSAMMASATTIRPRLLTRGHQ